MESLSQGLEFVIPLTNNDLINPENKRKVYYVKDVLFEEDVGRRISDSKSKFVNAEAIINEFDCIYSVFCHFEKLDPDVVQISLELLAKNFTMLHAELASTLDKSPTYEWKHKFRNIFKMNLYLLCIFTEKFETESTKLTAEAIVSAKGRGRPSSKQKRKNIEFSWEEKREKVMQLLYEVCQLPLSLLWEQQIIEEEVVNLITNCAYKLLENTSINHTRQLKDCIFHILGQMVAKYNHALSCSLKVFQLIQQCEHLAIPLAHLLELFLKKYSVKTIVGDIIREIIQMDGKNIFNDSSAMRSIATFLIETTQLIPSEIINYLSILVPFLEQESYVMRNCILSVITELVLKLLNGEELNTKQKNLRDQLLETLQDHIHDVNSFVRSRVLQLWTRLVEERAVPLKNQHIVLEFVIGRLKDKSNNVRKNAVHLITEFLRSNPFSAKFSVEELQKDCEKEQQKLRELKESLQNDVSEEQEDHNEETDADVDGDAETLRECNTEILKQQIIVQYLQDSAKFVDLIGKAIPLIANLLNSRHSADVLAAIEFFVVAYEFGLKESVCGIRKMLVLIGSSDATIKETVIESCERLYLKPNANQPLKIVKSLSTLALGANIGELTSLEELMSAFAKSGHLSAQVYQIFWGRFTLKVPVSKEERRTALVLLGMAASHEINIVKSNKDILISFGFGVGAELDFQIARETCVVLIKLTESAEKQTRYPRDDQIFTRLLQALISGVANMKDKHWISFMEKAVKLIYTLADQPDEICTELLQKLASTVLINETNENKFGSTPAQLTRLIATAGHVALCQLIYLDCYVFTELKQRQEKQQKYTEMKKKRKTMRKSFSATATLTPNKSSDKSMDEELMTGADTDDAEAELIRKLLDFETVIGDNLLAAYAPVIVEICGQFNRLSDVELLTAAATALAKFMLVSSEFCDDNLQLFVTMMEKSSANVIRENLVIAMGDLIIRFPNLTAPWACKLYNRLQDDCVQVRLNTLTVLSHLTFNDMIKAKGQISDVALCMVDKNVRIADAARLFFTELAKKGATIYNMLPDIISRLSDPDVGTDEEKFKIILKVLIGLIQKDRQLEGLVEKLCHRFRASELERQWHNLAFCMSLLSYSNKCLQKLLENFNSFGNKLVDPFVHDCFQTIINNAKKLAKPETKCVIEELEQKIGAIAAKGIGENSDEKENRDNGTTNKKKAASKARIRNKPTKGRKKLSAEFEKKLSLTPQKRRLNTTRAGKSHCNTKFVFSSDSDE